MSKKKKFKVLCECRKEIVGFSEHHASQNLRLHRNISKEHRNRMELIEELKK